MAQINNNEKQLTTKSFLVSETDEKGIITFANDDFCTYAGYTLDELIGKPHSIVRHPDMPKAAFADLWETVNKGERWRGFVKNLSKDGSFYWVYATVFPFESCDGSRGYISCRRKVSTMEAEKYTLAYQEMKREER